MLWILQMLIGGYLNHLRRNMKKIILTLGFFLVASINSFATQYYINYGTGNNSNSGVSTLLPFNTCAPVDVNNFLHPGDVVSIYYTNHFTGSTDSLCKIASAGNPSNHIMVNTYGASTASAGLTITVTETAGVITGGSISSAGTGYAAGQIVNIGSPSNLTAGNGGQFTVATVSAGVPQTITLLNGGQLYSAGTDATYMPTPTFDGSVKDTSIGSWSGYTYYQGKYLLTIPSSTVSANCVYQTPNSNNFTVTGSISGSTSLTVTSTNGAPNAGPNTLTYVSGSGTCPSTIAYSATSTLSQIYVSNIVVPFAVANVSVDGAYSLRRIVNSSGQTVSYMLDEYDTYYQSASGQLLYIELNDNTSPASHNIQLGEYGPQFSGLLGTDNQYGAYIDFSNFTSQNAFNMCVTSSGTNVTFTNVTGQFCGREGIYFIGNAVLNATGASFNTCTNCLSQWNNGYDIGNAGQGVTIEAPHVDIINSIVQFNWQAGIDLLSYPTSSPPTNPIDDRIINTYEHNNGLRAWNADFLGFDPSCIYTDGASSTQIINNVCVQDGVLATTATSNAIFEIAIGDEHPSSYPSLSGFDIINSLFVGGNYVEIGTDVINCSGTACQTINNLRIIGNTFDASTTNCFQPLSINQFMQQPNGNAYLYNNIFYKSSGSTFGVTPGYNSGTQLFNINANNNTYYNPVDGGTVWYATFGSGSVTLAQYQSLSGEDTNSQYASPDWTTGTAPTNVPTGYFLSSTSSGQGSNSPALGFAVPNYLGNQYIFSSIGTVLTNHAIDSTSNPASGYHYYSVFSSSSFPSTTSGSDIGPNAY